MDDGVVQDTWYPIRIHYIKWLVKLLLRGMNVKQFKRVSCLYRKIKDDNFRFLEFYLQANNTK